ARSGHPRSDHQPACAAQCSVDRPRIRATDILPLLRRRCLTATDYVPFLCVRIGALLPEVPAVPSLICAVCRARAAFARLGHNVGTAVETTAAARPPAE